MMTSSQCSWPGWIRHERVTQGCFDTGSRSTPHRFRSDEPVASMVRRGVVPESTGGNEPITAAYDRRTAAFETERQLAGTSGSDQPHDDAPIDHVLDILDASLGQRSTSAHDLRTAVSLTAANLSPLLRRVTNSLKTSPHQQVKLYYYYYYYLVVKEFFNERPHRKVEFFYAGQCNVTQTSGEHCSRLQQSRCHAVIN